MEKRHKIIYWITTVLFCALMSLTGVMQLLQTEDLVKAMAPFGYPAYFIQFIGLAKVLGALVLLLPGLALVKEWAYAGMVFNLLGAIVAVLHLTGSPVDALYQLVLVAIGLASWYYRPASRRLAGVPAAAKESKAVAA